MAGGLLAAVVLSSRWRMQLSRFNDGLVPLLLPMVVCVWLGCWQVGCAYGQLTPQGAWWGVPVMDESGHVAMRWPLQLAASLVMVIYFAILERRLAHHETPGQYSSLALLGMSLHLLGFSFLRADPAPMWNGLRLESWAAMFFSFVSLVACLVSFWPFHHAAHTPAQVSSSESLLS
jgi:hypothetical protein